MNKRWSYPLFRSYQAGLRETAALWFEENGLPVQYRYKFILRSKDDWKSNIILPEVAEYISRARQESERKKEAFPLHKFIHHGLSSQAMLFNLVGPLIIRNDLIAMSKAFIDAGIPWPSGKTTAAFEVEDREVFNERQAQPTSLDLAIGTTGDKFSIFVEAKLVEQEFGGCSVFGRGDCDGRNPARDHDLCYLHAYGRKYWELLNRHGFLEGDMSTSPICLLANYYQYFREVLFSVEKSGFLVFLVDERNPVFQVEGGGTERGLIPFLVNFLPENIRPRVSMVTIQQVSKSIESSGRHDDWIHVFKKKYGITRAWY